MKVVRLLGILVLAAGPLSGCASSNGSSNSTTQRESAASQSAGINVRLAVGYIQQGKLQFAQEKIERALKQAPDSAEVNTVAGVLNEQIGKWDAAERYYRRAVRITPEDGNVNNNLGTFLCKKGDIDESLQFFETAVNDPFYKTPEVAFANAGNCVSKVPDLNRAEQYYRGALELRPGYADALFQMMNLMYRKGEYLKARGFLQRFELTTEHTSESLLMAIRIEEELGDAKKARSYQDQLKSRFPNSPEMRDMNGSTTK